MSKIWLDGLFIKDKDWIYADWSYDEIESATRFNRRAMINWNNRTGVGRWSILTTFRSKPSRTAEGYVLTGSMDGGVLIPERVFKNYCEYRIKNPRKILQWKHDPNAVWFEYKGVFALLPLLPGFEVIDDTTCEEYGSTKNDRK